MHATKTIVGIHEHRVARRLKGMFQAEARVSIVLIDTTRVDAVVSAVAQIAMRQIACLTVGENARFAVIEIAGNLAVIKCGRAAVAVATGYRPAWRETPTRHVEWRLTLIIVAWLQTTGRSNISLDTRQRHVEVLKVQARARVKR